MLRQNNASSESRTKGPRAAFPNVIKSIAGRDHPGVRRRSLQLLAVVLKDRRILGRQGGEVIDGFVRTRRQACGRHIVAEDPTIDDLGEKRSPRDQFAQQVGYIFLPLRSERLLIAGSSAEGDNHNLLLLRQGRGARES